MRDIFQFFKTKFFLLNLFLSILLVIGLVMYVYRYLDDYTKHGESISVPDLRGMEPKKLSEFLGSKHLRYLIVDSVFDQKKQKGAVVDQDPEPNSKVKENRTVYLTVNATLPPQVKMPDLLDVSFRQAEAILQTYGLKTGELIYKQDLAKNAVLGQQYRGRDIKPGTMIKKGSSINLVLGDGLGNTMVQVPDLTHLTLLEALVVLKGSELNKGVVIADETVRDTSSARVYKQIPASGSGAMMNQGESIDLFVTSSPEKLKRDSLSKKQ